MFEITKKELLGPKVYLMDVVAPRVAQKALPGQFLIVRASQDGERIPLTVCDEDRMWAIHLRTWSGLSAIPPIW